MGNNVFANGREVSCKAADGKSICAFPDVCMTPPENPATPPGVPIPYPNTGMAKDTAGGSKTVKISRKETMLKNQSHFKKSMGDEAGSAAKKGLISSVNRGKIYFTSWSMDVKFEGKNVVRHLDMTTHNHASMGANEAIPWPYTDSQAVSPGGVCYGMDHLKLTPHEDGCPTKNGSKQTPHHLIPDRCIKGTTGYSYGKAPCICVLGKNQHTGSHRACHRIFDPIERYYKENNKVFDYRTARYAAAASAGGAMDPPRQTSEKEKACVESQLNHYYQQDPKGPQLQDGQPVGTQGARGKVNEIYDDVVAIFKS